ncbi:protein of unknown function [Jatrophihabitans endophyticus]|uniref:Calcineurin-like phosphoesterase n=1 Tax=Jatrophihabitans endophyticus TaxID=1206085 RepID=A0A1M5PVG1_9ACTN|nr:family 16 glycoside hydrolase [Jatrophihabitans endophyticus]SHH05541.1 protein of unknown function [Jatrophihabitans endophyticus]
MLQAGRVRAAVIALVVGATVATAAVPAATAAAAAPLPTIEHPLGFTDTFDNGRTDGWTAVTEGTAAGPAKWVARNGALQQTSNVYGGSAAPTSIAKPGTMFVAGSPRWRDYDFSVSAHTADDDAFGVVFRYTDRNNYYRFSMDRERKYRRLVAKVGGRYRTLAQSRVVGYRPGRSYRIRVVAVGADLTVLLDGATVARAHDATLPAGRFGLYTWGAPTTFDSVTASVRTDFFSIAVLPDTQYEVRDAPQVLNAQTRWLAANRADQNLAMVLHEGDVVDDLTDSRQWSNAVTGLDQLGGKIPFVVAAGNHDVQTSKDDYPRPVITAPFNALIGKLTDYHVDGRFARDDSRDTYHLFSAGGVDFLVLNLTFGAPDDVLLWAGQIADRYPARHVILLTHDYLGQNDAVRGEPGDKYLPSSYNPTLNDGTAIRDRFVLTHPNVQFAFSGHVIAPTRPGVTYSVGRLVSTNDAGRPVYQTLTNYQSMRGGQGYLRIFRVFPAQSRIDVVTYSPSLHTYLDDDDNRFSYTDVDLGRGDGAAPPVP